MSVFNGKTLMITGGTGSFGNAVLNRFLPVSYTHLCMYFTTSNCEKWQEQCGNCPNLQDGNRTWFFDKTEELLKDCLLYTSRCV